MTTVVVSAFNVARKPEIGGHFWVYLQYAHGLRRLGCDVFWLEQLPDDCPDRDASVATFFRRMERFGLGGRAILHETTAEGELRFVGVGPAAAEALFRRADLLLNFHYAIEPGLLSRFRRTALVDIDPGLLQYWISRGQLQVPLHDLNLTTGETVGTPGTLVPDCGLNWIRIRPPVCLDLWPYTYDPACRRFTTVSSWLGNQYVTAGRKKDKRILYDNTKRVAFLPFVELAAKSASELELALFLHESLDTGDRELLERNGWHVRHALEVAHTPDSYRSYIQASRGEFSCAKRSCIEFQNAWVSDRSLCYLASGKPVVVQDTGPSSFLPDGEGIFRFSTVHEAAEALATIEGAYERHCRAARAIAEELFDARVVLTAMLNAVETTPAAPRLRAGSNR